MSFVAFIGLVLLLVYIVSKLSRFNIKKSVNNEIVHNNEEAFGLYFADLIQSKNKLIMPVSELNQHLYVNATTGGGKTTLFLRMIEESIKHNMSVILIDGKGSFDLVDKLSKIAKDNNRQFKYFTFAKRDDTACYDFLGVGTRDELRNKLMHLIMKRENEYFYERLTTFIAIMFNILDKAKINGFIKDRIDLAYIYKLISTDGKLLAIANLVQDDLAQNYFISINDEKDKPQNRIINILTPIMLSEYGELFNLKTKDNIINISESIINNDIVLFMLDSSSYKDDTNRFGKIIVDDINGTFSLLNRSGVKKDTLIVFDEFGAYATNSIATTISIHRSNGLHAIIGSQSLETIAYSMEGRAVVSGIMANCNTHIILRSTNPYDLESFSKKAGTNKVYNMNYQVKTGVNGGNIGVNSMRIEDKYKVEIEQLRGLPVGVGYIYRVSTNKVEKIKILSANSLQQNELKMIANCKI